MRTRRILYPTCALLIPLGIRLLPETISPYPIGFDTVAYYIPIMLSRLALTAGPLDYFGGTILLYLPLTALYLLLGNAFLAMKIAPAFLLGLLGLSAYFVGTNFLKWNPRKALLLIVLLCSYFVTLRLSWDLQRNIAGLAFVLLTLSFIESPNPKFRYALVPTLAALAVMTHESAAILVAIIAAAFLSLNRRYLDIRNYIPFVPAAVLVFLQLLLRQYLLSQIQEPSPSANLPKAFTYNLGFILFAFWLVLPLTLIGLRIGVKRHLGVWIAFCSIFGLLPNLGFPTGAPYRWILILTPPLVILFVQGADVLVSAKLGRPRRIGRMVVVGFILAIILFSSGYLGLNKVTQVYFDLAPQYRTLMPVTMIESTVSVGDISSFEAIAHWANRTLPTTSALILPFQLYGWYLAIVSGSQGVYFSPTGHERNIDDTIASIRPQTGPIPIYARAVDLYLPQDEGVLVSLTVQAANTGQVYLVWWKSNSTEGIHSNLPSNFTVVYAAGSLAVFSFTKA